MGTAFHKSVFGVIKNSGAFGVGNQGNNTHPISGPLKWETDIAQISKSLVKGISHAGAKLPNSYPLPLCAHATEKVCVKHTGCRWSDEMHCYCYLTFAPSAGSASSSGS